jgi:hypothetical protein
VAWLRGCSVTGFGRTILAITFIGLSIATAIFVFKGMDCRTPFSTALLGPNLLCPILH